MYNRKKKCEKKIRKLFELINCLILLMVFYLAATVLNFVALGEDFYETGRDLSLQKHSSSILNNQLKQPLSAKSDFIIVLRLNLQQ